MAGKIQLTQGKFALVDDRDFKWLSKWRWHLGRDGYARRTQHLGKIDGRFKYRAVYLHKEIHPTEEGFFSDHINGDKLDNRRSNLRIATKSENNRNVGKQRNNTSGYKGVWWETSRSKWVATIRHNSKNIFLGRRDSPEEAYMLYCAAAEQLFGEFAHV